MSILHFLLLLLIAGICGSLGKALGGFSRGGWLVSIGLGFVGALVGTWLAHLAKFPSVFVVDIEGQPFPVVWSILGSALFVAVLGWLWRRGASPA